VNTVRVGIGVAHSDVDVIIIIFQGELEAEGVQGGRLFLCLIRIQAIALELLHSVAVHTAVSNFLVCISEYFAHRLIILIVSDVVPRAVPADLVVLRFLS